MPTSAENDSETSPAALSADERDDRIFGLEAVDDLDALTESQWRAAVVRSLAAGAARMGSMETVIDDNTAMTRATWDNTAEIREIVVMARSFFSGLGKFARGCARIWVVLKPIVQACTVIAGAYVAVKGAIWAATHGGQPPAPK